jgi:hypothetical protein
MGKDALQHKSFIAPQIRICTQLYELKIKDKICSPNYSLLFLGNFSWQNQLHRWSNG